MQARCLGTSKEYAPVVIVGAGPTGLTLSRLLSQMGMANLIFEQAAGLTNHPQVLCLICIALEWRVDAMAT
jgi:2-polyprenyl-6-methoxyphenol hydroxylase-like FAD-dependent oxidoreductase